MTTLTQLRIALAEAKIALRAAKDDHDTIKAIAEHAAILRMNGSAGKNDDERKRNLAIALSEDYAYSGALTRLRDAEAKVDRLAAEIAVEEDAIRANEARIREKLADALMGRHLDDAAAADGFSERVYGSLARQRIARGGYDDDHDENPF